MAVDAKAAVFLSYASQDAEAARRICDALRAAGVEVWFDQSELRGGDAWDTKIRDQISDCALFAPIITAATQSRREGYFRLEWKLADERTHLMAEGTPFLLPITIDDTTERGALVPKSFLAVQWTKLRDGQTPPAFVERVKKLLAGSEPEAERWRAENESGPASSSGKRGAMRRLVAIAGIAAVLAGTFFLTRKNPSADVRPPPAAQPLPVSDKSIAVLPFSNMSEDKNGNAFFADGVHEDILTNLAHISELRVISRTSVMRYAGTTKPIREIASELGVAYVLEGSVRRAGNKVRVTGQLINGRTDEHLWAEDYTRDLTAADVFEIQTELARKIAASMQAAISPREKSLLDRRPTENLEAYDLWLKARDLLHRSAMSTATRLAQEPMLERAVELDPKFTLAWCDLSQARVFNYAFYEKTPARLAKVKAAIDAAVGLEPDSPEVIRSVGWYYVLGPNDWSRAAEAFERFARLQPNSAEAYVGLEVIQLQQNKWSDALGSVRKAAQLDPGYVAVATDLVAILMDARRFDEALQAQRRVVELLPDDLGEAFRTGWIHFLAHGSRREVDEFFARLSAAQANSPAGINLRRLWATTSGNLAEVIKLDQLAPTNPDVYSSAFDAINVAAALAAGGDAAGARARLAKVADEMKTRLQAEPTNWRLQTRLELMSALMGLREEAQRFARELVAHAESGTPAERAIAEANAAFVDAWTGEKDRAIATYARLFATPGSGLNVHEMKLNPMFAPLQADPRYQSLLNDPKNNAPLF